MAMFRQYVLSLTAAALLAGILLSFFHEGVSGKILRLVCGILLTVTALQPLRRMELPDMDRFIPNCRQEAEDAAALGRKTGGSMAYGSGWKHIFWTKPLPWDWISCRT